MSDENAVAAFIGGYVYDQLKEYPHCTIDERKTKYSKHPIDLCSVYVNLNDEGVDLQCFKEKIERNSGGYLKNVQLISSNDRAIKVLIYDAQTFFLQKSPMILEEKRRSWRRHLFFDFILLLVCFFIIQSCHS